MTQDRENETGEQEISPPGDGAAIPRRERAMALDVGNRRIGLALSDPLGITVQPLFTMQRQSPRADLRSIARLVRKHAVTDVVIGDPVHLSGKISRQTERTREFAQELRLHLSETGVEARVHLLDERLTTHAAHELLDSAGGSKVRTRDQRLGREQVVDQVAAVLLLESFLSARSPSLLPPPPDWE